MAVGQVVSIPSGTHNQQFVPSGATYPSVAILNPNDGIVFVSQNRDTTGTNTGQWDYKVPSQSYAALPGPWQSVGMFYLDQSGSGAAGQVTIYPVNIILPYPDFHSIGRALQTIGTALDITESVQPANPGSGILRLWADTSDFLHGLNSAGVDATMIDTLTTLGGVLTGHMPNPSIANGAIVAAMIANGAIGLASPIIQDGAINAAKLQNKTITNGQIADGTITTALLAANSATHPQANLQSAPSGSTTSASLVPLPAPFATISFTDVGGLILVFGVIQVNASVASQATLGVNQDAGAYTAVATAQITVTSANYSIPFLWFAQPSAGSHTVGFGYATSAGTLSVSTGVFSWVEVLELIR